MQQEAILTLPTPTRVPLEQGQINWSQAAAQAEACLGNSQHAPK